MEDLQTLVRATLAQMPDSFDTHHLIRTFAHDNQQAYIQLLADTDGDNPFQAAHAKIGRIVESVSKHAGLVGTAHRSLDIFGQVSNCILWQRNRNA